MQLVRKRREGEIRQRENRAAHDAAHRILMPLRQHETADRMGVVKLFEHDTVGGSKTVVFEKFLRFFKRLESSHDRFLVFLKKHNWI